MATQRGDGTIRGSRAYPNHSHYNEMEGVGLAYTSASTVTMQTEFASFTTENGKRVFEPDADIVLDITTSGSGGLDTGSESANTWYSCWLAVAANGAPSDVIGLLSTSKTVAGLTFPSGYDDARLAGWIYNDGSSNIRKFATRNNGRELYCAMEPTATAHMNLHSGTLAVYPTTTTITVGAAMAPADARVRVHVMGLSNTGNDLFYMLDGADPQGGEGHGRTQRTTHLVGIDDSCTFEAAMEPGYPGAATVTIEYLNAWQIVR